MRQSRRSGSLSLSTIDGDMTRFFRLAGLSAIAVGGLSGFLCARPASIEQIQTVPSDTTPRLYVANQNSALVSVIDMTSNTVVETVDLQALGFRATAKPHHVVVEPDGSAWYLSLIAENRVLKFDSDNQLVGQIEFERPGMMALDPSSDRLYVGRSMAAVNPPQRIGVVDRATMELDEVDVFFPRPHAIAVSPSGRFVYSASLALNQLGAYDTETDAIELKTLDGATHGLLEQSRLQRLTSIDLSAQHSADRNHDIFRGFLFHDITLPACVQHPFGVQRFVVHREGDGGKGGPSVPDTLDQFEPVGAFERNVHDNDIRPQRRHGIQSRCCMIGFPANHKIGLIVDQLR